MVKKFIQLKVRKSMTASKAIGISEIKEFLGKKIQISELIEKIRNEASVMLVAGDWYGMDNFIRFGYGAKRSDLKNALDRITPVFKSL